MRQNRIQLALMAALVVALILIGILGVRAVNPPAPPPPPPTVDIAAVETRAISTFAHALTSTAQAVPTSTDTETPEATATAGTPSTAGASPTPSCYRLKYIQDVTIPDATIFTPAQVFTKTWQVQNSGTCALRPGFQLVLVGGVAMGGSPFVLSAAVNPGAKFDISIKMVAPTTKTGLIQGTWRMIDDNGNQFGDALTVVIVIGNASSVAPTVGTTATP
ncbi:MAG TPA: NBR1-Ig-like domain-containing protein [Anaerolineales bacterium]